MLGLALEAMKDGTGSNRLGPPSVIPELKLKVADDSCLAEASLADTTGKIKGKWNTKNLGLRLGADAVSASCSAALVAPLIAIIDR